MEANQPAKSSIKQQLATLGEAVEKTSPMAYYILFSLFIASFHMRRIGWAESLTGSVTNAWLVVYSTVLWGGAIYLFFVIVNWKKLLRNRKRSSSLCNTKNNDTVPIRTGSQKRIGPLLCLPGPC